MSKAWLGGAAATIVLAVLISRGAAQQPVDGEPSALEVFNQRILPIFRSEQPSSCVQCHLSSVDLKSYILPSHDKTFLSLRDQGLIDLEDPAKSKILSLIQMGDKDYDKGAKLIHEKTRRAEYEAFAAWIESCCRDQKLRDAPALSAAELAKPDKPVEVIRHARKSRVVDSFARKVFSQRMRCFPCHTPHEIDPDNPRHQAAIKTRQEFKKKYDAEQLARLDIFRETPAESLQYLIEASRHTPSDRLPLINLDDPPNSLLVLKPTSKLPAKRDDGTLGPPSSKTPVSHMGGLKMHRDDQSYKSFISWLQDYADVVGGRYASVEELPPDNWRGSQLVLRMTAAPESWPVGAPVQLFVYAYSEKDDSWQAAPAAFTQGTVTPRRFVNGTLFLLGPPDDKPATDGESQPATLPRGRYLVKAYVDSRGKLADDPALLLGDEDYVGQAELKRPRWREGFRSAETLSAAQLTRK